MFVILFVAFCIFQTNLAFQLQNKIWYKFRYQKNLSLPSERWFLLLKKRDSVIYF